MKKVFVCIIFLLVYGVCTAKPKIISSEPCEYRNVACDFFGYANWFREEVSYAQAEEDLDMLVYLIKSAYAGYDDAVERGLEVERIGEAFENSFAKNEGVNVQKFSQFIYDFLKPYIQDSHFVIESKDFAKQLVRQYRILYSNIYVKRIDDSFVLEKSDDMAFAVGKKLEVEAENLFAYPSEGDSVYRIGSFARLEEKEVYLTVPFSGIKRNIICNVDTTHLYTNKLDFYKEIETNDSVYIFVPTLIDLDKTNPLRTVLDENYKKFISVSEKYSNKKYIILDLRANGGGNDYYAIKFLRNLFYAEKNCLSKGAEKNAYKFGKQIYDESARTDYISPAIIQAEDWLKKNVLFDNSNFLEKFASDKKLLKNEPKRLAFKNSKKQKTKMQAPKYKGKLIILTGKNTASSAEETVLFAKKMFSPTNQLVILGENTMGCMAYGNIFCYQLPNSGIALHMGAFSSGSDVSYACNEGVGVLPDYWTTTEDILQALVNVTDDKELLEKLADMNEDL